MAAIRPKPGGVTFFLFSPSISKMEKEPLSGASSTSN